MEEALRSIGIWIAEMKLVFASAYFCLKTYRNAHSPIITWLALADWSPMRLLAEIKIRVPVILCSVIFSAMVLTHLSLSSRNSVCTLKYICQEEINSICARCVFVSVFFKASLSFFSFLLFLCFLYIVNNRKKLICTQCFYPFNESWRK